LKFALAANAAGRRSIMTVIDLKRQTKRKRQSSSVLVPLDKTSGAARYYAKMMRDIESDLGGRRLMSRIETELIRAFCGSATRLEYLNHQILLGDASEADVASYAQLASTMLRIGSRLGLQRRAKPIQTLGNLLVADYQRQQIEDRERNRLQREEFEQKRAPASGAPEDLINANTTQS
jgi:hypothetical protein